MWDAIALTGVLIFIILMFFRHKDRPPIHGIYQQKSKWFPFKYILFRMGLVIRKYSSKYSSPTSGEFGVSMDCPDSELDTAQPLSDDLKAFDAVFFIGCNKEGYYFTMGAERRKNGIINGVFYLVVPKVGLLCSMKLPDTVLFGAKDNEFGAEGILMTPVTPMKHWTLSYKGKMWLKGNPSTVFDVDFTADWYSDLGVFNYDTDLSTKAVARAVAREVWSKEHFENMKSAHQSRYEQMGEAKVIVLLDTKPHVFTTQSFRDHGFGPRRDWSLMHRYAFFHIFLDDGTMAAVGVVCQPCTCSTIETGFVCEPGGKLSPVEWCDLKLYEHGEHGIPPLDHFFQFKAGNKTYRTQVIVENQNTHYVGWDWEAKMVERFVRYNVNGIEGRGVSEFHYRYTNGRPNYLNNNDPEWFKSVRQEYCSTIQIQHPTLTLRHQ